MKTIETLSGTTFSGRRFTRRQLAQVKETVERFPQLSRAELARTLCEHLNWKTPNGKAKVESCLTMLEKLEAQGVVQLPPRLVRSSQRRVIEKVAAEAPIEATLDTLMPIRLVAVGSSGPERERWKAYLETFHDLGYRQPVGPHLGYLIVSQPSQCPLGCLLFSASAAWALAARDRWIGWDFKHKQKLLYLILSNDRFLIFPWVQVPNLASHALSLATRQIADDWVRAFGYRPVLIETFVDPTFFSGTCYRAANWQFLGHSQGRGRLAPDHQPRLSKKEIFIYPLEPGWRQALTEGASAAARRQRHHKDRHRPGLIEESFVSLWEKVVHVIRGVAADSDQQWRQRKRVIDTMMLMLLIFRLVSSKNTQSYGTTIDDLWDNCEALKLALPQKSRIAPSSFCAARRKLDEAVFKRANQKVLDAYADHASRYLWFGHRLFATDGSKINLPHDLVHSGYSTPAQTVHYPQGLLSCLYQLQSRLPFDFDLTPGSDERESAIRHLEALHAGDVVVYDRGYFSYLMLYRHHERGLHAIFRLRENSGIAIDAFFANPEQTDIEISLPASTVALAQLRSQCPGLNPPELKLRLLKYQIAGSVFCLGTTLMDPHRYPLQQFIDVYHGRWGIEELYKVSKHVFDIEDFHSKTQRGVKQEIFAHFFLITLNRLFANHADIDLNPDWAPTSGSTPGSSDLQTNFKNCTHVVDRSLESILFPHRQIRTLFPTLLHTIHRRHHRKRPHRSFLRRSMRPLTKWRLSKEKMQAQQAQKKAEVSA
jgi:Druantia protein DruA/Transposase DDE domain